MEERLQKVLARAGVGSRRGCEEYIAAGRVTVDGKVVRELGTKVDPSTSEIRCDGERLKAEPVVHYLVNKPRGFVCTNAPAGEHGRVIDLLRGVSQRLFCVGRLDGESEGLIIVTNDGALANRLAHPRYQVPKTYLAEIDGGLSQEQAEKLRSGVRLAEAVVRFSEVEPEHVGREHSVVRVVLKEGLNREIRRAFAALGLRVRRLRRVAIGRLTAPGLRPGGYRRLTESELAALSEDAGPAHDPRGGGERRRPRSPQRQKRKESRSSAK